MAVVLTVSMSPSAIASEPFIYPAKGQSAEQQKKDRYECHVWATEQTGFDPSRSATTITAPPAETDAKNEDTRNLIGGAALGTAVGAIAGKNIAESAAIGASTRVLTSRLKNKRGQAKAQDAYEADLALNQSYVAQKRADYDRASGACLTGRGYTVQ